MTKHLRNASLGMALGMLNLISTSAISQNWTDTTYAIASELNLAYKVADNFAGRTDTLLLDVSYPVNAPARACGQPLFIAIHGGAWIAGSKDDWSVVRMREEFAKRGYITASINYRKGLFNTNAAVNCNVPDWNCYNATDSTEWYRANFRGMLDARSAIEYVIDNYNVDPQQVYVVGESAGGFIALSTGFLDDESEVMTTQIAGMDDAPAPNSIYESPCIQKYNMASSIADMNLSRDPMSVPDFANQGFKVQGVGNFYGASFNDIFESHSGESPVLYMYHQPCDQVVYHRYGTLLNGFVGCLTGFPTYCGYIVNRPKAYGSAGIATLIDTLTNQGAAAPEYVYDNTGAGYNCAQQATTPSLVCHAIDNYWLRTSNMASLFAERIAECAATGATERTDRAFNIFPNPVQSGQSITINGMTGQDQVYAVYSIQGALLESGNLTDNTNPLVLDLEPGVYLVRHQGRYVKLSVVE